VAMLARYLLVKEYDARQKRLVAAG